MPRPPIVKADTEDIDAAATLTLSLVRQRIADRDREKTLPFDVWCRERFRTDLWDQQVAVANAVFAHEKVSWKGCHGIGKSFVTARIILRWLQRSEHSIVLLTGAQFETVKDTIFAEVIKAVRADPAGDWGQVLDAELRRGEFNYCRVFTTDAGPRIQGYHGDILFVIDEAQSMLADLMPTLYGIAAGGTVHFLMLGNPTNPSGDFARTFDEGSDWVPFTTGVFDTPNVAGYTLPQLLELPAHELTVNPRPELVGKKWVVDMFHLWGETSPLWKGRVLGEFPDQSADAVIWTQWLDQARANKLPDAGEEVYAGLDVAGGGKNETVLTVVSGGQILHQIGWADSIAEESGYTRIVAELEKWRDRLARITVDADGMGFTLARELRALHYPARMFSGQAEARSKRIYKNRKAEAWFEVRRLFERGLISGLTNDDTYSQLAAPTYSNDPRTGRITIEDKKLLAARGVRALDWADSLVLAFTDAEDIPAAKQPRPQWEDDDDLNEGPAYLDRSRSYWSVA